MGDTVFNIFGSHFEAAPRKLLGINIGENPNVGKGALLSKGATPSKINANYSTPKNVDFKKRTFLQNEGASIQGFCPKSYDMKRNITQSAAKSNLHVYEDTFSKRVNEESLIPVEYNRKPTFYDDASDDEFTFSDKQLDDVILGLPKSNQIRLPAFAALEMDSPIVDDVADDSLNNDYTMIDEQNMNIDEFSIIE